MKLLNVNEEVPEIFYIFVGQGTNMISKIYQHNYKLRKAIVSGGFESIMIQQDLINDFIEGNIVYAPFVYQKTTLFVPTSHLLAVVNSYNTEYVLENVRKIINKKFPSRFSCTYAFGDYDSCIKANKLYGWDLSKVKKFRLKLFNNQLDLCIKVVKCNMEIVTRMWNDNISSFDQKSVEEIATAYWNGYGQIASEIQDIDTGLHEQRVSDVLYEYLIEGYLEEIE